jgi:hypothetical protein
MPEGVHPAEGLCERCPGKAPESSPEFPECLRCVKTAIREERVLTLLADLHSLAQCSRHYLKTKGKAHA